MKYKRCTFRKFEFEANYQLLKQTVLLEWIVSKICRGGHWFLSLFLRLFNLNSASQECESFTKIVISTSYS